MSQAFQDVASGSNAQAMTGTRRPRDWWWDSLTFESRVPNGFAAESDHIEVLRSHAGGRRPSASPATRILLFPCVVWLRRVIAMRPNCRLPDFAATGQPAGFDRVSISPIRREDAHFVPEFQRSSG